MAAVVIQEAAAKNSKFKSSIIWIIVKENILDLESNRQRTGYLADSQKQTWSFLNTTFFKKRKSWNLSQIQKIATLDKNNILFKFEPKKLEMVFND